MNKIATWLLAVALVMLHFSLTGAQEGQVETELQPTVITADKMEYDHAERTVRFSGNVRVERPDFELTSRNLTVVFQEGVEVAGDPASVGQADKIEMIVAEGDVTFDHEGRVGLCERAVYMVQEETLRMEGKPRIRDGKNMISGQVITFSLRDNRSEILGGEDSRVEAVFFAPAPDEAQ